MILESGNLDIPVVVVQFQEGGGSTQSLTQKTIFPGRTLLPSLATTPLGYHAGFLPLTREVKGGEARRIGGVPQSPPAEYFFLPPALLGTLTLRVWAQDPDGSHFVARGAPSQGFPRT